MPISNWVTVLMGVSSELLVGRCKRQVLDQRFIRNDHPGGVRPGIADHPFHPGGGIDQLAQVVGGLVGLLQLRKTLEVVGNNVPQRDGLGGNVRDDLGHPVHFGEGNIHHAAHIAQGGARPQRAEGDDLGHLVLPVFIDGVIEHVRPAVVGEVQVDIGHRDAARVQEAFEEQFLLDGVHQGDIQRIGHDRTVGGAAGVVPDALPGGIAAQVPNDQEVGIEAHLVDDAQLVVEAGAHLFALGAIPEAAFQPIFAQSPQVGFRGLPGRDLELRQAVILHLQADIAAFGDQQGVRERLGHLGEQAIHLLRRAQVIGPVGHAHPVGVGKQRPGLDGEQDILVFGVFGIDVMGVVGGDEAGVVMRSQVEQGAVDLLQLRDVVLLEFEEEIVLAEDLVVPVDAAAGGVKLVLLDQARHLGRQAAGGADQALRVLGKEFLVDAGVVVKAFQLGSRGDLEQVLVAGLVLGQEQQVGGLAVFLGVVLLHGAGGHVGLHPDDGFDAGFLGGVVELDHAEHGAMVGDGQGGHVHLFGTLDQLLDIAKAVEQGVFGVNVEVGEGHGQTDKMWEGLLLIIARPFCLKK